VSRGESDHTGVANRIRAVPQGVRRTGGATAFREPLTALALVRKGYFPREVPPPFSTEKLYALLERAPSALPRTGGKTEPVRHNLARTGGFRRPFQVPNPRSYVKLADEFEAQWSTISARVQSNPFSMSQPIVTRTWERAVRPRFRYGEWSRLRPRDWRGQRFVLQTDVSQFYSSLYTQSIPWALEGKSYAKKNIGKTVSDKLDKALRNVSDGQTMGVPIGPDTSFLAAEIVLTAVDRELARKIRLKGHRYLDDYELAFRTRSAAEEAQALLEDALAVYELAINPSKTKILELPQPFDEAWTHELSTFPIRDSDSSSTLTDLVALFSRASALSRSATGPLKYALFRSRAARIEEAGIWGPFQNLVWSAVSGEPTTMATALDLLAEKAKHIGLPVDEEGAAEVIEGLISTHSPVRNASELAWSLWAAVALNVQLSRDAAQAVSSIEDDFVALLALHAESQGLFPAGLDHSHWEALTDYDAVLKGPHWLLAYEGSVRNWLDAPTKRIGKDPFFKVLRRRRVRFYDTDPKRNPFTGPSGPLPGGLVPDDYG